MNELENKIEETRKTMLDACNKLISESLEEQKELILKIQELSIDLTSEDSKKVTNSCNEILKTIGLLRHDIITIRDFTITKKKLATKTDPDLLIKELAKDLKVRRRPNTGGNK